MKYVRVMDGNKSNANGFEYKFNEVNIAKTWNPNEDDPSKFGGFNYSTYDKVLRWIHRGDTLVDVEIPNDAEWVLVDEDKGVYRSNKIIVSNPRKLDDDLIKDIIDNNSLSDKLIAQSIKVLLWKDKYDLAKYLIKKRVNYDNADFILNEFLDYGKEYGISGITNDICNILINIKNRID